MDFRELWYQGITLKAPPPEVASFGDLLAALVGRAGSGAAAARLLGVSPTTLYRWRRGSQRPKTGANVLRRTIRRMDLSPAREQQIRRGDIKLQITGVVQKSRDSRPRTIKPGEYIPVRVHSRILTTWLSGADDRAEASLWRAIDKYYTEGLDIDPVTSVDYR
jgi:transposase-like protein